jgi:excisionase family DNA binding protein
MYRFGEILGDIVHRDRPRVSSQLIGTCSTTEVAAMLGVVRSTVAGWIRDGHVQASKVEGGWRITPEAVACFQETWVRENHRPWPRPQPKATRIRTDGKHLTVHLPTDLFG